MNDQPIKAMLISSNSDVIQKFIEGCAAQPIDLYIASNHIASRAIIESNSINIVLIDIDPFDFPDEKTIQYLRKDGECAVIAIVDSSLDEVLIKHGLFNHILVKPLDAAKLAPAIQSEFKTKQYFDFQKILSFYRDVFDSLQETVVIVDESYRIIRTNRALLLMRGVVEEEICNQTYKAVLNQTCHRIMFNREKPCHEYGDPCPLPFLLKGKTHFESTLHVNDHYYLAMMSRVDEPGSTKKFFVETIRDVTEQKNAEDALRFQMAFEDAIDQVSSCLMKPSPDILNTQCEKAFCSIANLIHSEHLYLIQPSEIFDQWFVAFEWLDPRCPPFYSTSKIAMTTLPDWNRVHKTVITDREVMFIQNTETIPANQLPHYFKAHEIHSIALIPVRHRFGLHAIIGFESIRHSFSMSGNPIHLLRLLGEVVGNGLDRVFFETALRKSEERFRRMTENAPDMILRFNVDGIVDYVNPAVERILGYSREETIQTNVFDYVKEESRDKLRKSLKSSANKNYLWMELDFVHSKGSIVPCRMSLTIDRDESGRVIAVDAIVTDLREYKQMELEKEQLQTRLFQSQKMEAIGNLAAGVAHEINNPIGVILGFSEYLLDSLPECNEARETIELINAESIRIKDIVGKMMDFARMKKTVLKTVKLNQIARESLKLMKHKLSQRHIKTWLDLDDSDPEIIGHDNALKQVLLNLLINAIEAIPAGSNGEISILTKRHNSEGIMLQISDSGAGIHPEQLNHIFEPFHTTKEKGTGLGLSVTASIIRDHNGVIHVQSHPGTGTTFQIVFPLASTVKRDRMHTAVEE